MKSSQLRWSAVFWGTWVAAAALSLAGCAGDERVNPAPVGNDVAAVSRCDNDDGGLMLPGGLCAAVFADRVGVARHMAVSPSGDLFVALLDRPVEGKRGGILALRDVDGDGRADRAHRFGDRGGSGIAWRDGYLYFGENGRILRYRMPDGQLEPRSEPDVVVDRLPANGNHPYKTVKLDLSGRLLVNIGSASNACQVRSPEGGPVGADPCPELATRASLWRFDANRLGQTLADGERIAIGVRNGNAAAIHPETGSVVVGQNGRDDLVERWPRLYNQVEADSLPSEEVFVIEEGADYGWPYCYHDRRRGKVLAPEYGGDGRTKGRCGSVKEPDTALPAHWSPLGIHFYTGVMLPERYRRGAFIANHGSRFAAEASGPLPGYSVIFVPFEGGRPTAPWEIFASDFAGLERPLPEGAEHRPVDVTEGPDGSLYISDDKGGRIWRVYSAPH